MWALLCLALGVGAIAQVVIQVLGQMAGDEPLVSYMARGPMMAGLFTGFIVMCNRHADRVILSAAE